MTDDWSDYQSGPFCRHWADPSDCSKVCACCGHSCSAHDYGCDEYGCGCKEFVDAEESK